MRFYLLFLLAVLSGCAKDRAIYDQGISGYDANQSINKYDGIVVSVNGILVFGSESLYLKATDDQVLKSKKIGLLDDCLSLESPRGLKSYLKKLNGRRVIILGIFYADLANNRIMLSNCGIPGVQIQSVQPLKSWILSR